MEKVLMLLKVVPALIGIIRGLEEAITESGLGGEKLEAVKAIFLTVLDGAEEMWPAVEKIVTILVNLFNVTGVFKKE